MLPVRKNPRLREFDYSTPRFYFVTICTHEKEHLFGEPTSLSTYGKIAQAGFHEIQSHYPNVRVDKAVVMPNHIHMILYLTENTHLLPDIIGSYKSFVSRNIHSDDPERTVWQRSFHDHGIRTRMAYEQIWTYIENNPLKWKEDCFYTK